jgi:tetratricopeptide (TPR) repeat protein
MRRASLNVGLLLLSANLISAAQISKTRSNADLLHKAAQAITAGKLDQAEDSLQTVLRSAPKEYRALDLLGVVRVLQKREVEADKLFRRAVQANSDFAPAHAHLGLLDAQRGQSQEAVPQLREALRLDPSRSDASAALVNALQDQAGVAATAGESEKALALLIDARKYAPENSDVQFQLGVIALQMSLWQDAVDAFQQTLKLRVNDSLAVYDLGRASVGLAKFEDARAQFVRYIELRPDDSAGYCALGMTLAALQRSAEARTQFERSVALAPAQIESYYRLGLLDLDSNDWDAASRNLRQVLDREPKHAGALTALGRAEFEQKHYTEATDLLQRAIANDESSREAHYYLGLSFARLGRKQESEAQLQIAMQLEHDEAGRRRTVFRIVDPTPSDAQGATSQK